MKLCYAAASRRTPLASWWPSHRRPGGLLGAIYTQRVASYKALLGARRETELELHRGDGPVIQLLGVIQHRTRALGLPVGD